MDNGIFKLITSIEEKSKLWSDLAQAKGEILCKGAEDVLCKLRVQFYNAKTQCLECLFETPDTLSANEEYLGYFFLGGEKYYFQSIGKIHLDKVIVPIPKDLYHLQRRQNYRVHIPDTYNAFYNIVQINNNPQKITGRLRDLSSQGCRVMYHMDSPLIKMNDKVTGHLIIGKRPPLEIQGVVRHIKVDEANQVTQTFGIEFTPLSAIVENKVFMMTMEIHKEVFLRPASR